MRECERREKVRENQSIVSLRLLLIVRFDSAQRPIDTFFRKKKYQLKASSWQGALDYSNTTLDIINS